MVKSYFTTTPQPVTVSHSPCCRQLARTGYNGRGLFETIGYDTNMNDNFFAFQYHALKPLKQWGLGNIIGGTILTLIPGFWRHFGLQALSWGAIDWLLAIAGRRQALLKAEDLVAGDLDESAAHAAAERFRTILLINAGLDLLYIASGLWLFRTAGERTDRRGMGAGIFVQGLFLLLFDSILAAEINRRWIPPSP